MKAYLLSIGITSYEKSEKFYTGFLGLDLTHKIETPKSKFYYMTNEDKSFSIQLVVENKTLDAGSFRHVSLYSNEVQKDWYQAMNEYQLHPMPVQKLPGGACFFYVKDPDGYVYRIMEESDFLTSDRHKS
ncbi:MAG: VOC family protein [Candidatus Cloacimonetes bacterium]|nr:VOC family protein [Candidatus Cloacimonadota bacterium]